ncbi:MAG: hypothetical protein AVDCRST_MAG68-5654, partial [uncultured Gemmatimonadetes bacterium]
CIPPAARPARACGMNFVQPLYPLLSGAHLMTCEAEKN